MKYCEIDARKMLYKVLCVWLKQNRHFHEFWFWLYDQTHTGCKFFPFSVCFYSVTTFCRKSISFHLCKWNHFSKSQGRPYWSFSGHFWQSFRLENLTITQSPFQRWQSSRLSLTTLNFSLSNIFQTESSSWLRRTDEGIPKISTRSLREYLALAQHYLSICTSLSDKTVVKF